MSNGDDETFEVFGSTDLPTSNLLEKGRYKFSVHDIKNFISKAGNRCIRVTLNIEGRKLFDNLMVEGQMSWKWRQFLFSIGIREKRAHFSVSKEKILGKEGLADVGAKENKINSYSPIEVAIAPIKGIEPEEISSTVPVAEALSDNDL